MASYKHHLASNWASLASTVRPLAVRDFATARGWVVRHHLSGKLVLDNPSHPLRQIIIPLDQNAPDYIDAIGSAVEKLVALEKIADIGAIHDMAHCDADIIRFRVQTADSEKGDVSIADDVSLRKGAQQAILASACSVISQVRHHKRMTYNDAESFLASCRTAASEFGSYVAKFICPIRFGDTEPDRQEKPFARQSTELLMNAVNSLVTAIESNTTHTITTDEDTNPVVSSNLCDALLKLRPTGDGVVELTTMWASVDWLPPPKTVVSRVQIPTDYFHEIDRIRRKLRPECSDLRDTDYVGTVEELCGEVDVRQPGRAGGIVLSLFDRGGPDAEDRIVRARAVLGSDDYKKAIRAHEEGGRLVKIKGRLKRGLKMSQFDNILSFELIDGPD